MVWAGMCLFQLDESMCPCQESFTFPFFLGCCIQLWHCIYLLYLFLGCAGSSFGIYRISVFVSLPPGLTSFKWDQRGEKTHSLESLVRYNSKNKSLYSEKNDRQLASYSRIVLQEFCLCFQWDQDWALGCSEKWIRAMWFFIQTFPKLRSV